MKNFQYFVGDWRSGEVAVVDGAWDPEGLEREAERLGLRIVAYVATHYHWDHIGDQARGVPGMEYFVDQRRTRAYIHAVERDAAIAKTGIRAHPELLAGVENNTEVGRCQLREAAARARRLNGGRTTIG
jgi:glyoxylase-like metal-dependent hydrolase (beta-lactamase superfamily II)